MKRSHSKSPGVVSLSFLGGVRTVSGSSHLLTTPKSHVLFDAGLFYGHRQQFYEVNTTFAFLPGRLDAVVLSHAHIDHCGNIPTLIKHGLRSRIFCTSATRDLCRLMLADSGRVQEEDARYLKKIHSKPRDRHRRRTRMPALPGPLYTEQDALRSLKKFRPLSYGQRFPIGPDLIVTFYDAGHILGSSVVLSEVKLDKAILRLGYAVDLGRPQLPMLNDPTILPNLDYLILESTYGGRLHAPIAEAKGKLKETILRTVARRGKIIVPSFALERTQEVIYYVSELLKEKAIPRIPIYVDSPLATRITEVFRNNLHYQDPQVRERMRRDDSPFDFVQLRYVQSTAESKALNNDQRPMIIIAGSGMCEAGRILHHLKNNITESRNTVLVVGYMAKETLGKKIVDRQKAVKIYGLEYELNAEVVVINALSGHADQNDLVRYVEECAPRRKIFLVHGDEEQTGLLHEALVSRGLPSAMPEKGDTVIL